MPTASLVTDEIGISQSRVGAAEMYVNDVTGGDLNRKVTGDELGENALTKTTTGLDTTATNVKDAINEVAAGGPVGPTGPTGSTTLIDYNYRTGPTYSLLSTDLGKVIITNGTEAIEIDLPDGLSTGFWSSIETHMTYSVSFTASNIFSEVGTAPKLETRYSAASIHNLGSGTYSVIGKLT